MVLYLNIETKSGTYKLRNPTGRMGSIHIGILTKYLPQKKIDKEVGMSPLQQERMGQGFEEWSQKVLPNIFVAFTPKDQSVPIPDYKYEDIIGEDQLALFYALADNMEISEEFFRVIR